MQRKVFAFAVFAALLSTPAFAHHSTSMFTMATPVTFTGVVKEFRWTNPHAFIVIEVKGSDGRAEEWLVEWHSTAILVRRGYSKNTLKPGEGVTLIVGKMKDGSKMSRLLQGTTADGKKLWGDNSGNDPERVIR